jgi:hypothetical protein
MVAYLIGQFLAVYFSYKMWGKRMWEKLGSQRGTDLWVETSEFWLMFLVSAFWLIMIPSVIAWYLLDKLLAYIQEKINK